MNVDDSWVKNRDPQGSEDCVGVYLDLNFEPFDIFLGGASINPCDWNYFGPTRTAEVSALSTARIIPQNNMLAISFLKTGNMLLHPFSSGGPTPAKQLEFGEEFTSAINNAGIGAPFDHDLFQTYYGGLIDGTSIDECLLNSCANFSLSMLLRDDGNGGNPPSTEILPSTAEIMVGINAILDYLSSE